MNNLLSYIDDYFTGVLNDDEKREFEQRCHNDEAFAQEVAEYISMRDQINARLQQRKKEDFEQLYQQLSVSQKSAKITILRPLALLAAACVLLLIGWFTFFQKTSPQRIADNYISTNLSTLGLNMGVSDSLQTGISAYNSKSFQIAERLFKPMISKPETAAEAIKYLGLTYLAEKKYNNALECFDQLSALSLYTNPGKFYRALTLMERSEAGDKDNAKKILQEIIDKNLFGNTEARNWIKRL
ncbi:hypothetical protein ACPPVU_08310 [Mucilaginibacter sp. McL0603]|uniref:tetratricopeptide repeat protein n=1 Tax=Mucilaginibacter sp. McL0603 TaxID=3415670 RepID=UPI003CED4E45